MLRDLVVICLFSILMCSGFPTHIRMENRKMIPKPRNIIYLRFQLKIASLSIHPTYLIDKINGFN